MEFLLTHVIKIETFIGWFELALKESENNLNNYSDILKELRMIVEIR